MTLVKNAVFNIAANYKGTSTAKEYLENYFGEDQLNENLRKISLAQDSTYTIANLPEVYVLGVRDPWEWCLNGYIFGSNHKLIYKHCEHPDYKVDVLVKRCLSLTQPLVPKNLAGTVGYLGFSRWSHNYYHWMCQIVPRIILYRMAGFSFKRVIVDLLPPVADLSNIIEESLFVLGIPKQNICYLKDREVYTVDNLVSVPVHSVTPTRAVVKILRDIFYTGHSIPADPTYKKIYISRTDAPWGRLTDNEQVVREILTEQGFVVVTLNAMSIYRQAQIFSSAEVIVAPHGAGLTNIIFSQPGIKLLELMPKNREVEIYEIFAKWQNLSYTKLLCETVPGSSNIVVDAQQLKEAVKSL